MSLPVGSVWAIVRQGAPDRHIQVTESDSAKATFSARYVGGLEGKYTGELHTRQATILNLRLEGEESGYTAFHIGSHQGDRDEYVGAWGDVANGFSGTFRLVRSTDPL